MMPQNALTFRTQNLREEDGVLVGSDLNQEWLLRWWWERYQKHNQFPIAFIDFGMSSEMKRWCRNRGELIPLRLNSFVAEKKELSQAFVDELESQYGIHFWLARSAWFKKPFALLQSPFKRTLWVDLDCEVKGSISPVFEFANSEPGLSIALDQGENRSPYPVYNCGVISFKRGSMILLDWAQKCFKNSHRFLSDQDVLSEYLFEKKVSINCIPPKYNWNYRKGILENASILHYLGDHGKLVIRKQITDENLESILNSY